jgi:ABC-type glycerol-3-phosphate transport system substrate-binding protein
MSVRTSLLLIASVFALAACGGGTGTAGKSAPSARAAAQDRQQDKKDTSVFTPLTSTIDRAKSVQATVDQQAAKQRKLVEEESR